MFLNKIFQAFKKLLHYLFVRPFTWFRGLSLGKKILVVLGAFAGLLLLLVSGPIWLYYAVASGMFGKLPTDSELQALKSYQASEVYSADSVLMGRYFVENRSDARYEEVNKVVFDAIIATEDARFYEHKGVDSRSLIRVLFKSVLMGKNAGGGSTLSQQLVKNVYGRKRYGWLTLPVNKIREAIIANQMEKLYSKKEILMLYINTVSFGEDTYGIKTATHRFFGITPDKIKTEQAAVLAGMLKSPTAFNPRKNPERSLERRNLVLQQMLKYGYLTQNEADEFIKKPLQLKYTRLASSEGIAPHFREKVRIEIEKWLEENERKLGRKYDLHTDGLKIYTTIHSKLQKYAEEAVSEHLIRMQPKLQQDLKNRRFFKQNPKLIIDAVKKSPRYKSLAEKGLSHKDILEELKKPVKMVLYTHGGEKETMLSPIDSIALMLSTLQVGVLAVNPRNGQILAWVGSANYKQFQYDHVLAQRQVGSVFKPIVYAKALQDGTSPCDFIPNQKVTYTQYDNWTPENSEENYGGQYSVAGALANSVNTISVQLCMKSGIPNVLSLAKNMGIESELPSKPSIALGTADLTLKELTEAYTTFANQGTKTELITVNYIKDNEGKILYKSKVKAKSILPAEVAKEVTNMLRNVVNKGTGYEMRQRYGFRSDIAGKTGTTQDHRDAWFMGYTGKCLIGVWVGADNPAIHFSSMELGKGSRLAMPIWAHFYRKATNDPSTRKYVSGSFPFANDIECDMKREDGFFAKLFRKKNKNSDDTGFEGTSEGKEKKKKKFRLFGKRKD